MKPLFWLRSLFFAMILLGVAGTLARSDIVVSAGAGKAILNQNGTPFERAASLGYQFELGDFFIRPEGDYFLDVSGRGRSSLWAAPLFGLRALSEAGPELHVAVGPGWLQNPDPILGGHFQFALEGGIGLLSKSGVSYVGIAWKHLSSGGFEQPNLGRDFIVAQIRIRFPTKE